MNYRKNIKLNDTDAATLHKVFDLANKRLLTVLQTLRELECSDEAEHIRVTQYNPIIELQAQIFPD